MSKDTPFTWDTKLLCQNFSFSFIIRQDAGSVTYEYEASIYPTIEYWNYDEFVEKGFESQQLKQNMSMGNLLVLNLLIGLSGQENIQILM